MPREFSNTLKTIEILSLLLVIGISLLRWFYKFRLWPDSTSYLTAAINLLKHGRMFVNVNWPDQGFHLNLLPYTAYPPGFPIYLSFFVYLFKDPILAAAIAQSFALISLYLLIYIVTVVLDFIPTVRIATMFFYLVFAAFSQIQNGLLNEILYISICLGVFLCALSLWEKSNSKIWALALMLVFLGGTVRWNGFSNAAILLFPLWKHKQNRWLNFILLSLSGLLPNIFWFIRNKLVVGSATNLYQFNGILWEKVSIPFSFTVDRWGFGSPWILLGFLLLAFSPLIFKKLRNNLNFNFYNFVIFEILIQFLVIYILTLIVEVTPMDDRYLSPSYTFFVIILFFSISSIIRNFRKLKILVLAPWLFFFLSLPAVIYSLKMRPLTWIGSFSRPPEQELWNQILTKPYYQAASHFYSDDNFTHQIFVNKPHRIVWTNIPEKQPNSISDLWKIGTRPFFVVAPNTPLLNYFENGGGFTSDMKKEFVAGFWVIYKE